jgi:hypothetical protein
MQNHANNVQSTACPRCGSAGALTVGQSSRGGKLRWHESVNCSSCGLHSEADGTGLPPEEVRQHLMATGGIWVVRLSGLKSVAVAGKVLRDALGLDMKQLSSLLKQLPGIAYTGTQGESMWLADLLRVAGESPSLECVGSTGD